MPQLNGAMPEEDAVVVMRDILTVLAECNRQKVCRASRILPCASPCVV